MGLKSKSFCLHGHNIILVGRNKSGNCKECIRDYNRAYSKRNPTAFERSQRNHSWKVRGISIEIAAYDKLLSDQNYRCAICQSHQTKFKQRFAVDHNHKTGEIRGLLCIKCNVRLGVLESVDFVEKAANYLTKIDGIKKGLKL